VGYCSRVGESRALASSPKEANIEELAAVLLD
jgi:hypothetical protein